MFRSFVLALSVAVLACGCAAPPANLDVSLQRPTQTGRFIVALQPPATPPAINQIHAGTVKVATREGSPVTKARIAVDGAR